MTEKDKRVGALEDMYMELIITIMERKRTPYMFDKIKGQIINLKLTASTRGLLSQQNASSSRHPAPQPLLVVILEDRLVRSYN